MKQTTHMFDSRELEEFLMNWLVSAEYGRKDFVPVSSTFLVYKNKIECPVATVYNYNTKHCAWGIPILKSDRQYFNDKYFKGSLLISTLKKLESFIVEHNERYRSKHNIGVFFSRRMDTDGISRFRMNLLYYVKGSYLEYEVILESFGEFVKENKES